MHGLYRRVLAIGVAWLLLPTGRSARLVPQIIAIDGDRHVHFTYSAPIWKLNDPPIRAAMPIAR